VTEAVRPEDPFFYGSVESRISPKGQIAMPKRFRDVLGVDAAASGFVLLKGEADCLYLYTHRQFGAVRQRVKAIAVREGTPEFFRQFMESVVAVDLDNQGRFVLPQALRQEAGLTGADALFVGMDDRIELWSPQRRSAARKMQVGFDESRKAASREIFGL